MEIFRSLLLAQVVSVVLWGSLAVAEMPRQSGSSKPKKLLLIGQEPDGHARETHEYMAGMRILSKCLEGVEGLDVQLAYGREPWPEGPELLRKCDGAFFFVSQGALWMQKDSRRYAAFTELAARGGGIGAIHWGIGAKDGTYRAGQIKLLGASRGGPRRPFGVFRTRLSLATEGHPVLRGIADFEIHDEFYYQLEFVQRPGRVTPLITAAIDGNDETVAWAWPRPDGGRSFGFTGLHFHKNWKTDHYRRLVAQGAMWIVGLDVPTDGLAVQVDDQALRLRDGDRSPPADFREPP